MTTVDAFHEHIVFPPDGVRQYFLNAPFDPIEQGKVVGMVEASEAVAPFRYVVTPNADHVVRLNRQPELRPFYDNAWMTLCDSRPIFLFARTRSQVMTHVTGSDLTVRLFKSVIRKGDRIVLIVGDEGIAASVRSAYPDIDFRTHVPPLGLWKNPEAMQQCVNFIERERGRFTFIAVGAPQSEKIAYMAARGGASVGVGFCIGAGLEFLVGTKKRAPLWMQRLSIEWLYRMASDPRRLWRRYVYGALPLLFLFAREATHRRPTRLLPQGSERHDVVT